VYLINTYATHWSPGVPSIYTTLLLLIRTTDHTVTILRIKDGVAGRYNSVQLKFLSKGSLKQFKLGGDSG
jgi:hypothetical protein